MSIISSHPQPYIYGQGCKNMISTKCVCIYIHIYTHIYFLSECANSSFQCPFPLSQYFLSHFSQFHLRIHGSLQSKMSALLKFSFRQNPRKHQKHAIKERSMVNILT